MPEPLGPSGGPLRLMCEDGGKANPHHAQVSSQPPRCNRHYDRYQAHLTNNRRRRANKQPENDWDPGPASPEDQGHLLIDPDDLDILLGTVLPEITKARLAMYDAAERPDRRAAAVDRLDAACKQLLKFFDEIGAEAVRSHRPDR